MTAVATQIRRGGESIGRRVRRFWSGITAVSIKELRGRMRGRRAFAVLTVYLLLLGLFSFAIYVYLKQQAALNITPISDPGIPRDFPGFPGGPVTLPGAQTLANGTALSAGIGHGIFSGLLLVETLLVLVLAPAFTTGAISLEREKQTLDLLVTTPLSTLGMVIGKLFSALSYVFLLIIASIPFASLVFVFGGVGPEDLVRAYVFLLALAFGMGAMGLFISALVKRTQTATVATFVIVLLLTFGTAAAHQFWQMASKSSTTSVLVASKGKAPEAALWLNPFVADLDMICATAPDSYHLSCDFIAGVTGKPYFGTPVTTNPGIVIPFQGLPPQPGGVVIDDTNDVDVNVNKLRELFAECPPNAECAEPQPVGADAAVVSFGFPRDTFWPKSAAAFVFLGVAFTLLSAQLVSPTRRLRLRRPHLSRRGNRDAVAASDTAPAETAEQLVEVEPVANVSVETTE
jgi:ABC-type transport system involved in multi-copper enzyme maturation permease subunit